jgi:hypothetical protein
LLSAADGFLAILSVTAKHDAQVSADGVGV